VPEQGRDLWRIVENCVPERAEKAHDVLVVFRNPDVLPKMVGKSV
jgi:hypothetical protein